MDQRKRLIELLCAVECKGYDRREGGCNFRQDDQCNRINKLEMCMIEQIADHLLANGVIVPPCKVGDTVWIAGEYRGVYSVSVRTMFFSHSGVEMVRTTKCDIPFHDFGKVAFFTQEEAEKALAERNRL